jgi:hypothetical protein
MPDANACVGKAMSLWIDCDCLIGGMYEQGLAQLKTVVETQPTPQPT